MATEEDKQFYKEHRHEPYQQLERAMKSRDLRKIRYLIRSGKVDPNLWASDNGDKPLLFIFIDSSFSLSQKKELIRLAVAHGADIHVKDRYGSTVLDEAKDSTPLLKFLLTEFKFSNEDIWEALGSRFSDYWDIETDSKHLKLFLEHGLQISMDMVKDLLFRVVKRGDVKSAKFLMTKYHVSVNCADKDGLMPIHHAVSSLEMVKFLLAHGADVNSRSRSGVAPLMLATSLEIFNFLIERGADVYAVDQQQRNVLLWQIENSKSLAIIKVLVEQYHFDVNQPDEAGTSPLMLAAKRKDLFAEKQRELNIAKYLVDNGANINAVDNEGRNVLFYLYKDYEPAKRLLQYLITQGINVNHLDKSGRNVLFYATKHIELLLKAGTDATVVADDGTTVLMNCRLSFSDFKRLIRHGADPSEYAQELLLWWLPSVDTYICEMNAEYIMVYLIRKYSLNPNTRNENGRTLLFYCGDFSTERFLKLGTSLEVTDKDGNTPLIFWIAIFNHCPSQRFPQQYYQRQNNEGKTALHYAVIRGMGAKTIRELLDCGADWRIKDNSGRTALDYARELKRFDICELMENYNHSI